MPRDNQGRFDDRGWGVADELDGLRDAIGQPRLTPGKKTLTSQIAAPPRAGGGAPLPHGLRQALERALDVDLGPVRVHDTLASAAAARSLQARALTVGQDIHFGPGMFDPSSTSGQRLIAHEVAHTVQQGGAAAAVQTDLEVGEADGELEQEAEDFAQGFVAGRASAPIRPAAAAALIQRDPAPADFYPSFLREGEPFTPRFSYTTAPISGRLGEEVIVPVSVSNAADAPPGLDFQWTLPSPACPDPVLVVAEVAPGPSANLRVRLQRVVDGLCVAPMLSIDGQAHRGPAMRVHIAPPVLRWDVGHELGNNQGVREVAGSSARLMANDTLVVRLSLDGAVAPESIAGLVVSAEARGHCLAIAPEVTWEGNLATVRVMARGPGRDRVTVRIAIPGWPAEQWHRDVIVSADLTWIRDTANTATSLIASRFGGAAAAVNLAVDEYERALAEHRAALRDYWAARQLTMEILRDLFFTVVFAGAGSTVSSLLKNRMGAAANTLEGAFLIDASKDVAKFAKGASRAIGFRLPEGGFAATTGVAGSAAGGDAEGVGLEPVRWGRGLATRLLAESSMLSGMIAHVQQQVTGMQRDATVDVFEGFDGNPVDSLANDDILSRLALVGATKRVFAEGLWSAWIERYAFGAVQLPPMLAGPDWEMASNVDGWGDDLLAAIRTQTSRDFGLDARLRAARTRVEREVYARNGWPVEP